MSLGAGRGTEVTDGRMFPSRSGFLIPVIKSLRCRVDTDSVMMVSIHTAD